MDPVTILNSIVKIAQEIYRLVNLAESNKKKLKTLACTIEQTVTTIQGLSELPRHQQFIDTLKSLNQCLQETKTFISKVMKESWTLRLAHAGKNERQLDEFKNAILELYPQVTLGLSAQLLVDREQDRRDEEDDRRFFVQQQERLLREIQAIRLEPQDFESILRKQLASFEERLTLQLHPPIMRAANLLPEDFLVSLCDLTFEQRLGDSNYGTIYTGTWRNQPVMIKSIDYIYSETDRNKFIHEAQIMSRLRNEFIVPFYGACLESTRLCLLMGVMEKGALTPLLTTLSLPVRLQIAEDLAFGLAYLHDQNMIHGDIKSDNIGINQNNQAKWMGFGLTKTRRASMASINAVSNDAAWQAPESWQRCAKLSQASDMYSFGVLLWTLITAQLPFKHLTSSEIMSLVNRGQREAISSDIPKEMAKLIIDCWSADITVRPRAIDIAHKLQSSTDIFSALRSSSPTGEEWYRRGVAAQEVSNMKEAYQCYELALHKHYVKAYTRIGLFKLQGLGDQVVDKKAAICHLENAAHQGDDNAMYNLGRMHEKGDNEEGIIDYPAALFWYKRASSKDPICTSYQNKVKKITDILSSSGSDYKFSKK